MTVLPAGSWMSWRRMPFALAADSTTSRGEATLEGDALTLVIGQAAASHPFGQNEVLVFTVTADVDDGRIRLVNRDSGEEQTSAPR